eukprot:gb/GECG01006694.1/.p1 GENE.gb/GECG01006694.1/~~gb/GECG01006694.1/.p1  ORF type:complete len:287 (+),score=37.96 gb/GECG01006694.1/:1-861(+)
MDVMRKTISRAPSGYGRLGPQSAVGSSSAPWKSGRGSGSQRSHLTAFEPPGSAPDWDENQAKEYSRFEFSVFRQYFYGNYGWFPTLIQARELKNVFVKFDPSLKGTIPEDKLKDVLSRLEPAENRPLPFDEIVRQFEESSVKYHGEGETVLLWPLLLRAMTFEDQKVEDTVCLLRYDVRQRIEEDQSYIRRFDKVLRKLQHNDAKVGTENGLKRFFLEELLLAPDRTEVAALFYLFERPTNTLFQKRSRYATEYRSDACIIARNFYKRHRRRIEKGHRFEDNACGS